MLLFSVKAIRKWIVVLLSFGITGGLISCNSHSEKTPRYKVGVLCGLDFFADTFDGFKEQMTRLGYVEGENISYDFHTTNFEVAREEKILRRFLADKVDVILTFPTEVSLHAKQIAKGSGIPVVFANANVEGVDLVHSILEPGEGITGVRYPGPDIVVQCFEYMMTLLPEIRTIWTPFQRGYPIVDAQLEALREPLRQSGVTLLKAPLDHFEQVDPALKKLEKNGALEIDAIFTIAEPLTAHPVTGEVISGFARNHKLPAFGPQPLTPDAASILSITTDNLDVGRQAAQIVHKILMGSAAGNIPVVSAERYLHVNYRAARAIDLQIPEGILSQARKIIR